MRLEMVGDWLPALVFASALVATLWLFVRAVAGRHLSPTVLVLIGWLVIGRFFLPAPMARDWGLDRLWRQLPLVSAFLPTRLTAILSTSDPMAISEPSSVPSTRVASVRADTRSTQPWRPEWKTVLGVVWISGVFWVILRLVLSHRTLRHRIFHFSRMAKARPPHWAGLAEECQRLSGLRRVPRLVLHEGFPVPFVCGLRDPVICLPAEAVRLSDAELRHVLTHEMLHLRKGDLQINLLLELLKALWWFNPLFGVMVRALIVDREVLRDAQVLQRLGESGSPAAYGSTLVRLATGRMTDGAEAGGIPFFRSQHEIQRRLTMMLAPNSRRFPVSTVALAVVALVATASLATSENPPAATAPVAPAPLAQLALGFPDTHPEAPAILEAVRRQEMVHVLEIQKAELYQVFDAGAVPMKHADAAPEGGDWRIATEAISGAHAPEVLRGNFPPIMLWGPYAEFPAGRYVVVYRFKLMAVPESGSTLFFDVSHDACTRSGLRRSTASLPKDGWQEIAVPVELTQPTSLEFRFWPDGSDVALDRLYVFQITQAGESVPSTEPASLPLGRAVAGRTEVIRSPHTEDGGLIDISGLASGAKVRCPYTGNFFRVP